MTTGDALYQLCGFADESEKAYAAVVYLRVETQHEVKVHLVAARTDVAPLKGVTIPGLELCAALLLTKRLIWVKNTIDIQIEDIGV